MSDGSELLARFDFLDCFVSLGFTMTSDSAGASVGEDHIKERILVIPETAEPGDIPVETKKPTKNMIGKTIKEPTRPMADSIPLTRKDPTAPPPETDSPGQRVSNLGPGQIKAARDKRAKTDKATPSITWVGPTLIGRPFKKMKVMTKKIGVGQKETRPKNLINMVER
jgi:hypothetical protein